MVGDVDRQGDEVGQEGGARQPPPLFSRGSWEPLCVARAVSVVRCVSVSMGGHAPANLASFSLHEQNGRGVRAGRAERGERSGAELHHHTIERNLAIFVARRALGREVHAVAHL